MNAFNFKVECRFANRWEVVAKCTTLQKAEAKAKATAQQFPLHAVRVATC